jgi:hypothetical protein
MVAFAIDNHIRSVLALFQAERGAYVKLVFESGLLRVPQNCVQHILRSLQIAVGSQAHTYFGLGAAVRLHQRKYIFRYAPATLKRCVQEVMSLVSADFAEEFLIAVFDKDIVMALLSVTSGLVSM